MIALAKALLLIARYFRRIAISLEQIKSLYELELKHQGIMHIDPTIDDEVEISYGSKSIVDQLTEP